MLVTCLGLGAAVFAFRRWKEAQAEAHEREMAEAALRVSRGELEQRVQELFAANANLQAKIAEHKRAGASLSQSEEFNRRLVAASPIGILLLDAEFKITYDNPALRRLMGVPKTPSSCDRGKSCSTCRLSGRLSRHGRRRALLAGEAISAEALHYRSLMGQRPTWKFTARPYGPAPDQAGGTILLVVDVTARARDPVRSQTAAGRAGSHQSRHRGAAHRADPGRHAARAHRREIQPGQQRGTASEYDPAREEIQLAFQRGWQSGAPNSFKLGEGIPGHVVATGQAYLARELRSDRQVPEASRAFIPPAWAACASPSAPLKKSSAPFISTANCHANSPPRMPTCSPRWGNPW